MPTYEYRCEACGRKVTLFYKTYATYDEATRAGAQRCTHCGSPRLTRLISRVAIQRSPLSRLLSGESEDSSAFDNLDDSDPRVMGRLLREMSAETGEDLGPEFEEVVGRLERGEDPETIENSLPADFGGDDFAGGGDLGGGDLGGPGPLPPSLPDLL
jgi:putative FmdB family regulatory protein